MIEKIVYRQEDEALVIQPIESDAIQGDIDFEALKTWFLTLVGDIKYIVIDQTNIYLEPNDGGVVTLVISELEDSTLFDAFILACENLLI